MKHHLNAIGHAINGLRWALRTQPNYNVHILLSLITIIGGFFFQLSYVEWLVIIIMICGGLTVETLNTSIERLGDAITTEYNDHIKLAKDLSASAVLLFSVGSLVIACILFLPKIAGLFLH